MLDSAQHILSNICVATLIAAIAWFVGRSGRHSALAHLLWVSVFLKLVTPPIAVLTIPVPAEWIPGEATESPITVATTTSEPAGEPAPPENTQPIPINPELAVEVPAGNSGPVRWSWVIAGVWLAGFLVIVLQGAGRFLRLQSLIRNEGEIDGIASGFVEHLVKEHQKNSFYRRDAPPVVRLPIRISPMLFGVGRKTVIVCPELLWHLFSEEERCAFLAHETAHYCRRDHWVRWIEWTVSAVYWWLPLLAWARRQMEHHEEACCDSWAVQQLQSSPRSYAEALLKAVDFMSSQRGAIPRMATSMQATNDLERRLRLVMRSKDVRPVPRIQSSLTGTIIVVLMLLHPLAERVAQSDIRESSELLDLVESPGFLRSDTAVTGNSVIDANLPSPPQGFWTRMPPSQWAEFSLSLASASVTADSRHGLRIRTPGNDDLVFTRDELTTMVDLPHSQRIVIGSSDGSLRVWDLESAEPVSLIGRHSTAVVSIDYHESCGLVSSDASGVVLKWNLQSGERLASYHIDTDIQSVRISSDSSQVAVLTGAWQRSEKQTLTLLDSTSLAPVESRVLNLPVAIMVPTESNEWLLIDWAGNVRRSDSEILIARIPKPHVSALVFASIQLDELNGKATFNASVPSPTEGIR